MPNMDGFHQTKKIAYKNEGVNSWHNDSNGKHEYLTWKTSPEELTTVIED
ncbi:hypothetical protein FACS1894123_04910 [Bacteroidia bacterium]|nr:hypothetical protein FACS1894123_04910 [Bacteroidia bacterium]